MNNCLSGNRVFKQRFSICAVAFYPFYRIYPQDYNKFEGLRCGAK